MTLYFKDFQNTSAIFPSGNVQGIMTHIKRNVPQGASAQLTGIKKSEIPFARTVFGTAEGKSSSRGGGFRRRVTWKGGLITDHRIFYEGHMKYVVL